MTAILGAAPGPRGFAFAAQVAAALLEGAGEQTFPGLGSLATAPHFGRPLRRAAACERGLADLPLDAGFVRRIDEQPQTRLCILLLGQPIASVRAAATGVAAAILHRGLVGVVMKADRDRLKGLLGEDAFAIAFGEAVLLDTPLAQLGAGERPADAADLEGLEARIASVGAAALVRFVELVEPVLAAGVARRLPEGLRAPGDVPAIGEAHRAPIVRLLRRRGPGWATLIA